MQLVMRVNTECTRAKITCDGRMKMILGVNKRHKSEGGNYRVTEKTIKVQQVPKATQDA